MYRKWIYYKNALKLILRWLSIEHDFIIKFSGNTFYKNALQMILLSKFIGNDALDRALL